MAEKESPDINYDPLTNAYANCSVARGIPMGGMGSGCFHIGSDGMFTEFRINNNWMAPIRDVRGAFFAVHAQTKSENVTRILRRQSPGEEYRNIKQIASTVFKGELPGFVLSFQDDQLPVAVCIDGFTPHVPHNVQDSTLPCGILTLTMENISDDVVQAAVLFSFENILGMGGSGNTGMRTMRLSSKHVMPVKEKPKLVYRDRSGNYQKVVDEDGIKQLAFRTEQQVDVKSHRAGCIGEYRIAVLEPEGFDVSFCDNWNAAEKRPAVLEEFHETGRISSPGQIAGRSRKIKPAGAAAACGTLGTGQRAQIDFIVAWWMPDHVTEKELVKNSRTGFHDGKRAGHAYENYFNGPDDMIRYVVREKKRLRRETFERSAILDRSSLPGWLVRAMKNAIDSTLCNTVIPKDESLYTIEGVDWQPPLWPFGGLTGTNDQRLSAHPYTSVFYTDLDKKEVDSFRRHMRPDGSCPHGNGNCDLALDDPGVPYGWPMLLLFALPEDQWTDLNMSEIIQAGKLYRITGDKRWIETFWPDMKQMIGYLDGLSKHGVPEGGTTYDIWSFPGTFLYAATLYLASLRTMMDIAAELEPDLVKQYREMFDRCRHRIDDLLWQEEAGYFSSTPEIKTVFTGGLAGDWAARYAGLGSVLNTERIEKHLKKMYAVLIEAAREDAETRKRIPFPWPHATPDGGNIRLKSLWGRIQQWLLKIDYNVYTAQILNYHAMEHIYYGQVKEGLAVIKMIYDLIYRKGNAWSAGLHSTNESIYMTHPVIWAVLNALTGAALDVPRKTLHLAPKALPGQAVTRCPFFFPGFWAMLEYSSSESRVRLEVLKHFGKPVKIETIAFLDDDGNPSTISKMLLMEKGLTWQCEIGR